MRKFLFKFLGFLAAVEGVRHVEGAVILFGAAAILAVIACIHFLTAPLNPDVESNAAGSGTGKTA